MIAFACVRFVIMIRINGGKRKFFRQRFPYLSWLTDSNQQIASVLLQFFPQLFERLINKQHAPIRFIRKLFKNFRIENKKRNYRDTLFQRMKKTGIIIDPKIAAEPEND